MVPSWNGFRLSSLLFLISAFTTQSPGAQAEDFHRFKVRCSVEGTETDSEGKTKVLKTSALFSFNNRKSVELHDESLEPDHWTMRDVIQFTNKLIEIGWNPPDPHAFVKIEIDRLQHKITGQLRYEAGFYQARAAKYTGTCEAEQPIEGACVWHMTIGEKCEGP